MKDDEGVVNFSTNQKASAAGGAGAAGALLVPLRPRGPLRSPRPAPLVPRP